MCIVALAADNLLKSEIVIDSRKRKHLPYLSVLQGHGLEGGSVHSGLESHLAAGKSTEMKRELCGSENRLEITPSAR